MSDSKADPGEGLPASDARHGEPEPATVEEVAEVLARTPAEQAALDALADDPDGQSLEALRQHLRRHPAETERPARSARYQGAQPSGGASKEG